MGWGPEAPDMSGANEQARVAAQIAREQWDYFKSTYAPLLYDQTLADMERSEVMGDLAIEQQRYALDQSKRYDDRYWGTQVPLEDRLIKEATEFNTEAEQNRMAAEARVDAQSAYTNSMGQMERGLRRIGVNPNSGAYAGVMADTQMERAKMEANAVNKTRVAAQQLGWSRLTDAAAIGRGLPGFSGDASRVAIGWGSQGLNNLGTQTATAGAGAWAGAAQTSGGMLNSASQNLRLNAIESAKTPGFDFLAGIFGSAVGGYATGLGKK